MLKHLLNTGAVFQMEDETGSGGYGYEDFDDSSSTPSTPDRTDMIASKVDKLGEAFSQYLQKDEERQRSSQTQTVENQIRAAQNKAKADLDNAEKALANALDEGDGGQIARAQRGVAELAARRERVNAMADDARERLKQAERKQQAPAANEQLDTTNLEGWKSRNASWYGIDKDMTKHSHTLDAQIRENGVLTPGSAEYFEAIDRQMKQKFPDRFGGTPPTGGSSGYSSGGTGGGGRQVRIPASIADGYRRMGINVDDPAVAKRMSENRSKAVSKGWLSEQMNTGRVLSR